METTHYTLEVNEYGDAHLERHESRESAFRALEQSQLVTMRAIVPESVVLADRLTHREMLRLYKVTLQDILEHHPVLDAAFWRFSELDCNGGCNLTSDILDAWYEGAFNAARLVSEIEEEITFILSRD